MEAVIQSAAPGSGVTQRDHQHSVESGKTTAAAEDNATRQCSSGDGNVDGPKIMIASELVGLFPQDVRLWWLAPRFRDAEHWSQGPAEAHRMVTGPPLGRGEDAEGIEGNRFSSPTRTGGA